MISVLLIAFSLFIHSGNSFKNELEGYLKKNLSNYKDFKYEIVQMPGKFKHASILKTNEFNISGNLAYVPVKITNDNNRTTNIFITVRLKLYQNVLVAAHKIKYRKILSKSDFKIEKENVAEVRGTPIKSFKGINNLRSKVSINAGEILTEEAVEEKPVINVGDIIKASVNIGTVYVSTQATARQEGRPGDIIRIMTKDKKQFKAKVIDSHNVIIVE